MKKRTNTISILLIVVGLIAVSLLVWKFGLFRERFQDPKCPSGGSFVNGNCYSPPSYGTAICPVGAVPNQNGNCGQGSASGSPINAVDCSSGQLTNGLCLQQCPSGTTLSFDIPQIGPLCRYNTPAPSTPTPPTPPTPPAPSSKPTPTANCTSFTRNIPGGSLEVKCF